MKAILYARWSPRPGADDCQSAVNQFKALRQLADKSGWPTAEENSHADEDLSGGDWERPGLWAAIRQVEPGDMFLAYSLDRIARDSTIFGFVQHQILSRGGEIVTIENGTVRAGDPVSKCIATIFGAFAELQRSMIGLRSKNAARRKLTEGIYRGRKDTLPYGYRWVDFNAGKVEEDLDEQATVALMRQFMADGLSKAETAAKLNAMGQLDREGKQWVAWRIRNVLGLQKKPKKVRMPKL